MSSIAPEFLVFRKKPGPLPGPPAGPSILRCGALATGLPPSMRWQQDCPDAAPAARAWHVVDAHDEGQTARKECVSKLGVEGQVVALPPRAVVIHGAAGEDV